MTRKFSELQPYERFEIICWVVATLVLVGFLIIVFSA